MFTIIANLEIKDNLKIIEDIKTILKDNVQIANVYQDNYNNYIYSISSNTKIIISLGGDGTVLQSVQNAIELDVPILAFNTGTLGFLAEHNIKDLELILNQCIRNNYKIEDRFLIEVYKDNKLLDICLNDCVITREGFSRIITFDVIVNDEIINHYMGDGIILSTPTGSTGYNLSLGGPILSPNNENIIITPIACHTLSSRSIVLDKNCNIKVKLLHSRKTQEKEGILTCDGRKNIDLHSGDILEIKQYPKKVKFIKFEDNFFKILKEKLY